MTIQEVIRAAMRSAGMTQKEVAEAIGGYGQSKVSMALKSNSMRTDTAVTLLNACGFELVAIGSHGERFVIGDETQSAEQRNTAGQFGEMTLNEIVRGVVQEELKRKERK